MLWHRDSETGALLYLSRALVPTRVQSSTVATDRAVRIRDARPQLPPDYGSQARCTPCFALPCLDHFHFPGPPRTLEWGRPFARSDVKGGPTPRTLPIWCQPSLGFGHGAQTAVQPVLPARPSPRGAIAERTIAPYDGIEGRDTEWEWSIEDDRIQENYV